jgi:cysteine-rich repeat protein
MTALLFAAVDTASGLPAPNDTSVLILDTTVVGGASSAEALEAAELGLTPVVVDAETWRASTASDFATYRAIVLGDPTCEGSTEPVAIAEANRDVWGPVVKGNVVVNVTDPAYHGEHGGTQLTRSSIAFAADADSTGAYVSLSCYYADVSQESPVVPTVLAPFGVFAVFGQLDGCPDDSHIVAVHPALKGLTDESLSGWECSAHGGFEKWPEEFNVLAISRDLPSSYVASDGESGLPYIVARGEKLAPIACGDGIRAGDEECDAGDAPAAEDCCSDTCRLEPAEAVCRPAEGVCDVAERCSGSGDECPPDAKSRAVCRPATDQCDEVERCDGVGDTCPTDQAAEDGTACNDGLQCTTGDTCSAGSCAGSVDCPEGQSCDGGGVCSPAGLCPPTSPCDDRNPCTTDRCDAASGCIAEPVQNGLACDDGNPCTANDACGGVVCAGEPFCAPSLPNDGTEIPAAEPVRVEVQADKGAECFAGLFEYRETPTVTVGNPDGQPLSRLRFGRAGKRGRVVLRLKLNKAGKARLRAAADGRLAVVLRTTVSSGGRVATLRRLLVIRRH